MICVSNGKYALADQLAPKARQTITGLRRSLSPTITCQAILFCIDGSAVPEHVTLKHLILDGAKNVDVRTGNSWKRDDVEARNAFTVGIVVNGSGVVVSGDYAHNNGQFGLRAVNATNLKVTNTEIAFNATDPQACLTAGTYQSVNNVATSNSVVLSDAVALNGVDDNGGISASNSWSGDVYTHPDCTGLQWQWWEGSVEQTVNFAGWQALGQDATGSCAPTAPLPPLP